MPVILSALSEMLEFSYLFNPLSGRENKSGQEPSMVEGADTQAQETAGAGERGRTKWRLFQDCSLAEILTGLVPKASFMGSIFSSKTEVIGGRGGGWTVLDLGASLLSMRKGNETRKEYETPLELELQVLDYVSYHTRFSACMHMLLTKPVVLSPWGHISDCRS